MIKDKLIPEVKEFKGYKFKYYVDINSDSSCCFWADWKQVAEILDRLSAPNTMFGKLKYDNFSKDFNCILKLTHPERFKNLMKTICASAVCVDNLESHAVEVTLLSFKGLLELLRYGKSDSNVIAFIDFLWEIADEINGTQKNIAKAERDSQALKRKEINIKNAEVLQRFSENPPFPLPEECKNVIANEMLRLTTGYSCQFNTAKEE